MSTGRDGDAGLVAPADDVDNDIRRFLELMSADSLRIGGGGALPPVERRRVAEEVRRRWVEGGPDMAGSEDLRVGALDTRIRIHRPVGDTTALPTLLYIHGGGWTIFSIDTHDRLMRELAARVGCAVVGIDYSLAPEAKFPRAIDESVDVVEWLRANGATKGLDAGRLAMGGDSAGANLALATNLALRERGMPTGAGMLLCYGAFDTVERPSYARYGGDGYMLTGPEMAEFWEHYLNGPADAQNPLARPMLADLSGMPPAFLCIPECDILLDENRAMAQRLRDAGVAVEEIVYPGATHSFLEAVNIAPLADRALDDAARWLRALFERDPG